MKNGTLFDVIPPENGYERGPRCDHPKDARALIQNMFTRNYDEVCTVETCNATLRVDVATFATSQALKRDPAAICDECRSRGPHCPHHGAFRP